MEAAAPESPFPATRWTVVLRCRNAPDAAAQHALAELCRDYWYPLYVFARRRGLATPDAEDATQSFFAYLLERNLFAGAEPQLGKLRTFLLTAFERFLRDAHERAQAQKRGGGRELVSLDAEEGERRYALEPLDIATPERMFERTWALTLLQSALLALRTAEATAGRGPAFSELEPFISPTASAEADYSETAARLGVREDAVRQMVSRLRGRFRAQLRQVIADTLHEPTDAQIDGEVASLRAALRG